MPYRIGSNFIGSDRILTSSSKQEVIPPPPETWTTNYSLYKFIFSNAEDCTVSINGGNPIFINAYQGLNIEKEDARVHSFVIQEEGIRYTWIGFY